MSFLIDELYGQYPHSAVYARTLPTNEASRGLLESLGFSEEGRLRKEAFWDGEYRDTIVYSLLREEWMNRSPDEAETGDRRPIGPEFLVE